MENDFYQVVTVMLLLNNNHAYAFVCESKCFPYGKVETLCPF